MHSPSNQSTALRGGGGMNKPQQQQQQRDIEDNTTSTQSSSSTASKRKDHRRWARRTVDWMQSIPVSPTLQQKLARLTSQHENNHNKQHLPITTNNEKKTKKKTETLYWITGLDKVVFENQSVAEAVKVAGYKPLPYLCYMLSGMVCDVFMLLFDFVLHFGLHWQDATVCWLIGFAVSIIPRHTALKIMCFGNYVGGYYASLGRMYFGMSFTIALSTVFNYIMTKWMGVAHYVAWLATLIWTGVVNYFILKKLWTFGVDERKISQSNK
jgi:hypothetical protein